MAKREYLETKFNSPFGRAVYPYIHAPDTAFQKTEFKTGLRCDPKDPDTKQFVKQIKALLKKSHEQGIHSAPFKLPFEKDEDGTIIIPKFKTIHEFPVFDASGDPLPSRPKVGGGSKLRVAGVARTYEGFGHTGVTLYMNAVQISDLQEFGSNADSYGFDAVEGFAGSDVDESTDPFAEDEGDLDAPENDPLDGDSDWAEDF